ncbi:Integrase core domain-containing protein, partial [Azotobacter vinelandii]
MPFGKSIPPNDIGALKPLAASNSEPLNHPGFPGRYPTRPGQAWSKPYTPAKADSVRARAVRIDPLYRAPGRGGDCAIGGPRVGDSYDNALAETINGLYKPEVIHRRSWRSREQVELAALDWVHWYNHKRLLGRSAGQSHEMPARYWTGKIVCLVVPVWSSAPLHRLLAEGPDGPCFGPPAESLSLCSRERESNQRESAPDHPAPATPGLPRSGAAPGARREGTSLSLRDSLGVLPRVPLRDTCARPPERESVPSCLKALLLFLWHGLSGNAGCPLQEA